MLDMKVKDWTTERHDAPVQLTFRSLWLSFLLFFTVAAAIWIVLFGLSKKLPFVQNGAAAIAEEKWAAAQTANVFAPTDRVRILDFGNSKTLAGFRPSVFGSAAGSNVGAYNLAIPGDSKFLDLLETALSHGPAPTHVFVQGFPQTVQQSDTFWSLFFDTKRMLNLLFPFRSFVRDAIIFAYESRNSGGLAAQYKSNAAQVQQIKDERGYYFIKSQSHYPGDRLPDDYALPTDRPGEIMNRKVDPTDAQFDRLMRLAEKYDFRVLLVPVVFRRGEFADPPAVDSEAIRVLEQYPRAQVIGPAYWLYELRDFSDPVHLNVQGADRYSTQLAALFKSWLASER